MNLIPLPSHPLGHALQRAQEIAMHGGHIRNGGCAAAGMHSMHATQTCDLTFAEVAVYGTRAPTAEDEPSGCCRGASSMRGMLCIGSCSMTCRSGAELLCRSPGVSSSMLSACSCDNKHLCQCEARVDVDAESTIHADDEVDGVMARFDLQ